MVVDSPTGWMDTGRLVRSSELLRGRPRAARQDAWYYRRRGSARSRRPMIFCEAFVPSRGGSSGSPSAFRSPPPIRHGLCIPRGSLRLRRVLPESRPLPRNLEQTRGGGGDAHGWGIPVNWQTRTAAFTGHPADHPPYPMSTKAFPRSTGIDKSRRWRRSWTPRPGTH